MSHNSFSAEAVKNLPPHLSERIRLIEDAPLRLDGEFILYWMHHAVRSHENPAIDTALRIAAQLKLPVLVYQGLGGRHPFNSDRHHTFIMEGAREVQQRLQERQIMHVFYLGRKPSELSPLNALARRAALVITEEFPSPPFPQWTRQLAGRANTAVWAVDCTCIIPMQSIKRSFARAYAFRNHTQEKYEQRLRQTWEDVTVAVSMFKSDCGFDALDLANADLADLCAQWARETISQHKDDPREKVYSWERLYRGKSGDALWDAAQKSLLVHGELHNNVRMSWGKAFLNWTSDPQTALDMMIDLNHRLALDGNDANSYGGLLWCLGLFDRPFKPDRPVIGALRPRSTKDHARRLDMSAYADKIKGPAAGKPLKIAVIGAGISGLFAARTLMDHDHYVHVFEKASRPGGRTAAFKDADFVFDSGAQYFTVRDERTVRFVRSWQMDGIVAPWKGRIGVAKQGRLSAEKQLTERWVGISGMDAIAAHLSEGVDIRFNMAIESLQKNNEQWQLMDNQQNVHGPYDAVIVAAPPPQANGLVELSPKLSDSICAVEMQPCLSVMIAFNEPLDLLFDAIFVHGSAVRWGARNNSKPQRGRTECWTLHANAKWSEANAHTDDRQRISLATDAFFNSIGHRRIDPIYQRSFYWECAAAANPLNVGCLWDARLMIGMCGDWCQMSRIEGAILSGMAMAGKILSLKVDIPPIPQDGKT